MDTRRGRKLPKQDDSCAGLTKRDAFIDAEIDWHYPRKNFTTLGFQ